MPERDRKLDAPFFERERDLRPVAERARDIYKELYGESPTSMAVGKMRAEFIGNCTDVLFLHAIGFPLANVGTIAAIGGRDDRKLTFYSTAFDEDGVIEVDLDKLEDFQGPHWVKYVIASVVHTQELGVKELRGANFVIHSNGPKEGGVASSAAVEMAVGLAYLHNCGVDMKDVPSWKIAQAMRAGETDPKFVKGSCGYLDQACSIAGRGGVLLEFKEQADGAPYGDKPVDLTVIEEEGYRIVIGVGQGFSRILDQTGYPHKAAIARRAREELIKTTGTAYLSDFYAYSTFIETKVGYEAIRALEHLLEEDNRVLDVASNLSELSVLQGEGANNRVRQRDNLIKLIFRHINVSGQSSLNYYGVADAVKTYDIDVAAVPQLRYLVNLATQSGAVAARTHGGGWNTNFLAVVHQSLLEEFMSRVNAGYQEEFGNDVTFIEARVGDGSQVILVPN